jgi:hypothetical protein
MTMINEPVFLEKRYLSGKKDEFEVGESNAWLVSQISGGCQTQGEARPTRR